MAKLKKPTVKKAQNGVAVTQDNKGVYTYTKKVNTKDGPRYYQGKSLDRSMAEIKANLKNRATPADSTRRADISALKLKTMDEEKKKGGVIKKKMGGPVKKMQSGGKAKAKKEYDEQYKFLKEARNAIGKNDKKKLSELRFDKPYNNNDLANDFSKAQQLRKKAGLGIGEEAKLLFPHVGQQMRGAVNSMLGTNFKKGGIVKKSTVKKTVAKKVVKLIKKKK